MPAAARYIPSDERGPDLTDLEDAYYKELRARQTAHAAAWKLYKGDHHRHLQDDGSGTDDNVVINLVGLLIDKGLSAMVGTNDQGDIEGVTFDIVDRPGEKGYRANGGAPAADPLAEAGAEQVSPAQAALDETWDANKRDIVLHNAIMNGGVCGHVFLKVVPDGKRDLYGEKTLPRVINLNPDLCSAFWDEADIERVLWYRVEYGVEGKRTREDTVRAVDEEGEDLDAWEIHTYREVPNQGGWIRQGEPVRWEYDWAPILDWPNLPDPNGYYGISDLRQSGGVNDSVNFLLSNLQRIIKHHAHPKTVALGVASDEIKATAVDRLWTIRNENAQILNLEMQSDLSSSMELVRMLRRFFFDGTREVDPSSVHDRLGDLTNFALRVLYTDTLSKVGTKRLLAGDALQDLNRRLLALLDHGYAHRITVTWPQAIPTDDMADAQALAIDRQHGLSRETYLDKRGYDFEQEMARVQLERGERIEDATVQQQASVTSALEGIGRRMMLGSGVNGGA